MRIYVNKPILQFFANKADVFSGFELKRNVTPTCLRVEFDKHMHSVLFILKTGAAYVRDVVAHGDLYLLNHIRRSGCN